MDDNFLADLSDIQQNNFYEQDFDAANLDESDL